MATSLDQARTTVARRLGQAETLDREETMALRRYFHVRHPEDLAGRTGQQIIELARRVEAVLATNGQPVEPVRLFFARPAAAVGGRSVATIKHDTDYAANPEAAARMVRPSSLAESVVYEVTPTGERIVGAGNFVGDYVAGPDAPAQMGVTV